MGSIPLPALGVKPVEQPDLLQRYGQLQQLQGMQQERVIRQQQIEAGQREANDAQAMTAAMQQWDGKNLDELPSLVIKNKGSAKAVIGLRSSILQQKEKYSQIAKDDAETGQKNLQALGEKHDMVAGQIRNLLSLPDEQLAPAAQQTLQQSVQSGLLKPEEAQQYAPITQLPPDQIRAQLSYMEKNFMGDKAQREAAQQEATQAQQKATAAETARHNQAMEEINVSEPKLALRAAQGDPDAVAAMKLLAQQKLASRPPRNDQTTADAIEAAAQSLASMNPKDLSRLKDIASLRGDQRLLIYNRAKQLNPNFSTAEVDRKAKMLDSFTNGKDGQQLQSFGTFLEHAGEASRITNEFRTTSIPLVNTPLNAIRSKFGDASYSQFIAALEPVRKEFEGFLLGGRALYGDDRKAAETILSDTSSPAQIQAALKQMGHTVKARQNEIETRFKNTMGSKIEDVIGPMSDEALEGARQIGIDMGGRKPVPSGQSPNQPIGEFDWNSFPDYKPK